MEVDEALGMLGTVGRWQIIYYTIISTACMVPACIHMLAINFIGKSSYTVYMFCITVTPHVISACSSK